MTTEIRGGERTAWTDAAALDVLLRHGADLVVVASGDGRVVWASPSVETVLGYRPEELVGTNGRLHLVPEDTDSASRAFEASNPTGTRPTRMRARHRDGSVRHLDVVFTDLLDHPGVGGILVNARDMTAVVEADLAQRTGMERFQRFAESAPVGILFTDAVGRTTYVNDRWLEINGVDRSVPLEGGTWIDATHPDDRASAIERARADIRRTGTTEFEHRLLRPDGAVAWVRGRTAMVYDEQGASVGSVTSMEDVTGEVEAARRDALLDRLVQESRDLISIYDADGAFTFASPSHRQVLGYEPDELVGTSPVELLHPDEVESVGATFAEQLLAGSEPAPVAHRVRCKDGSYRFIESIAIDLTDDPAVGGVLVNARDVTERLRSEQLEADQARILGAIARGVPLGDTLADVVAMVERWLPGGCGLVTLVDDDDVIHVAAAPSLTPDLRASIDGFLVPPDKRYAHPSTEHSTIRDSEPGLLLRDAGFESFWVASIRSAEADVAPLGAVMLLRPDDIDPDDGERRLLEVAANVASIAIERDRAQARLAHQAKHDALTGLPNRDAVLERLRHVRGHPRRGGPHTAVLFLDIDRFKVLNDSVGHGAGDRLLIELAARLQSALRPGDLVARFGGDEFVMVCEGVDGVASAYELAGRVLDVVRRPFMVQESELVVTASVGIALVDDRPPEELLRDADTAMYWAKERGRARAELFDEHLRERVVVRLDVERELRRAVDAGDFVMHYQPIVSLVQPRLAAFEALLRWPHPTRGLLSPEDFLGVAEECGLMRPIGAWVREEACRQAVAWREAFPEWGEFVMGFNLSAAELTDPHLGPNIERTIRESGVEPGLLSVEITERLLFEDAAATHVLFAHLRDLGVLLALDDFGTGYSPLVQLKEFPVHTIKVDQSFVSGLGRDPYDDAIVEAVLDLARRLDLFSVAEGVENEAQEERLRASGCLLAQGHRFAPALPPDEVERLVTSPDWAFRIPPA